jgi:hypothetical protein
MSMQALPNNRLSDELPLSALNFVQGHAFVHASGEAVRFMDSRWLIVPKAKGGQVTLNFESLPDWLIRPTKLVMARGWLEEGMSPSWLSSGMSAFRRLADSLCKFQISSIEMLTAIHAKRIQDYLITQQALQDEALEKAAAVKGRPLNQRERRQVTISSGCGVKTRSRLIALFNSAVAITQEIDCLSVNCHIIDPCVEANLTLLPSVGSADSQKVLSPEQIAILDRAARREAHRYLKARGLITAAFSRVDLGTLAGREIDPTFLVERYFGLNGHREHTQQEIGAIRGLSPTAHGNVGRLIRQFLTERLGQTSAVKIMALRRKFGLLTRKGRLSELETAREYIHNCLKNADLTWIEPNRLCLELYFGLSGHQPHSLVEVGKLIGCATEKGPHFRIHSSLTRLFGERTGKRIFAIRDGLLRYLTRSIKAQAVRLQLGAARRIEALLRLPAQPVMRVGNLEGRRVVEITFRAGKTWGDEGMPEAIPFVEVFGEIAEDAIRTTQELTRDLRNIAPEGLKDRLFLIPDKSFHRVTDLSPSVLQAFIFTGQEGRDKGILQRNDLEGLEGFQFHDIRKTHATRIVEEGGSLQDVARYLGHNVVGGNTSMAGVWYVAGGTDAMRKQAVNEIRRGAATGRQFDVIARLQLESMGEQAKRADIPPNQLSFEEAKRRILTEDILEEVPVSPDEAVLLLKQKIVINITRYGGCMLSATSGLCPTANACPIGIDAETPEVNKGCGCKYQVIMPHTADQLEEDLRIMTAQVAEMSGDEWYFWRTHILIRIQIWQSQLEIAQSLQRLMEDE